MPSNVQTARRPAPRVAGPDFRRLNSALAGSVLLAGDAGWDAARQAWNLAVDQQPAAVAMPHSVADVVAIVDFARESGVRVAPQGTGHNAHPLEGRLGNSILLRTDRMRAVAIDPENRRARIDAGALWMDVTGPASEHGLAALAGSSPLPRGASSAAAVRCARARASAAAA